MILLAGFSNIDSSPPTLSNASQRAADRHREPRNQTWALPGGCCLRCSGLLVPRYLASLESDLTGRPMRLRRCVSGGDCVDRDILTSQWMGPVPARETEDSCAKIVFPPPVKSGVIEVRMPKTEEAKKNAITVKIDRVLVS